MALDEFLVSLLHAPGQMATLLRREFHKGGGQGGQQQAGGVGKQDAALLVDPAHVVPGEPAARAAGCLGEGAGDGWQVLDSVAAKADLESTFDPPQAAW